MSNVGRGERKRRGKFTEVRRSAFAEKPWATSTVLLFQTARSGDHPHSGDPAPHRKPDDPLEGLFFLLLISPLLNQFFRRRPLLGLPEMERN